MGIELLKVAAGGVAQVIGLGAPAHFSPSL